MPEDERTETATRHRVPRLPTVLFVAVVVVASAILAVVGPRAGSAGVMFEVTKACIQVLGVAVLGGAISYAAFVYQRDRIERYEDLRRGADRCLEDRRREDDFLRRIADQALGAYNEVKKVRRNAVSRVERERTGRVVPWSVYQGAIGGLNEQQLVFETLAHQAPLSIYPRLLGRRRSNGRPQSYFDVVEVYLNKMLRESQAVHPPADGGHLPLASVPRFRRFLDDTHRFRERASLPVRHAVEHIHADVRRPVDMPVGSRRVAGAAVPVQGAHDVPHRRGRSLT